MLMFYKNSKTKIMFIYMIIFLKTMYHWQPKVWLGNAYTDCMAPICSHPSQLPISCSICVILHYGPLNRQTSCRSKGKHAHAYWHVYGMINRPQNTNFYFEGSLGRDIEGSSGWGGEWQHLPAFSFGSWEYNLSMCSIFGLINSSKNTNKMKL